MSSKSQQHHHHYQGEPRDHHHHSHHNHHDRRGDDALDMAESKVADEEGFPQAHSSSSSSTHIQHAARNVPQDEAEDHINIIQAEIPPNEDILEPSDDDIEHDFDTLPVIAYKDEILQAIRTHQIIIIIGETGSGKTTQMPQFFLDHAHEFLPHGQKMAITQPRRIAAISVAQRVCEERATAAAARGGGGSSGAVATAGSSNSGGGSKHHQIGEEVGYTVRFDDQTSSKTKLKYMTDGILIRECLQDQTLSHYNIIMLDEAHERSLNTDILFALVKEIVRKRKDLKLIVTSATLDSVKFGNYFHDCPIIHIPGRLFPVDIYHSKQKQIMTSAGPANQSYIQSAVDIAMKIHQREEDGHILVFLTGQEDIEKACTLLRQALQEGKEGRDDDDEDEDRVMLVMPLYSALSNEDQVKIFQKPQLLYEQEVLQRRIPSQRNASSFTLTRSQTKKIPRIIRKCVFATNIAETSITVPHVKYVIDAGFIKQKVFDPTRSMESLVVVPISKIAALQRAGRAGRTGPGHCYRLYSSECFDDMLDETVPEIQRTNLANTLLYLKAIGITDVLNFDFLDPPSEEQVLQALASLHLLQAIDDTGRITALGRKMSSFPLDPHLSRMLIAAGEKQNHCLSEVTIICAMLCVENIWRRPKSSATFFANNTNNNSNGGAGGNPASGGGRAPQGQVGRFGNPHQQQRYIANSIEEERCEIAHAGLRHDYGDFLTLYNVFTRWERNNCSYQWCEEHFVQYRSMKTARKIHQHLQQDVDKNRIDERKYPSYDDRKDKERNEDKSDRDKELTVEKRICNAITAGYFMQAATKCGNDSIYKCLPLANNKQGSTELRLVYIHQQSAFHTCQPSEYVVYQELVHQSSKMYMRMIGRASRNCIEKFMKQWKYVSPKVLAGQPSTSSSSSMPKQVTSSSLVNRNEEEGNDRKRMKVENNTAVVTTSTTASVSSSGPAITSKAVAAAPSSSSSSSGGLSAVEQAKLRYLNRKSGK